MIKETQEEVMAALATNVCRLVFVKSNGEVREAFATMHPEFLPESKGTGRAPPSTNVLFYDLTVEGYRSCVYNRIVEFEINNSLLGK